mgnify:CR=1 FL=1
MIMKGSTPEHVKMLIKEDPSVVLGIEDNHYAAIVKLPRYFVAGGTSFHQNIHVSVGSAWCDSVDLHIEEYLYTLGREALDKAIAKFPNGAKPHWATDCLSLPEIDDRDRVYQEIFSGLADAANSYNVTVVAGETAVMQEVMRGVLLSVTVIGVV